MVAQEQPPRTSLLEELFLALLGHTGDVFIDGCQSEPGKSIYPRKSHFKVATDLDFVEDYNREVLDGILELGYHNRGLEAFVQREQFSWSLKGGSQYRCALANGVRELLDVYAAAILQAQKQLRGTINPSLATLNYFLAEFKVLLPSIHHIVLEVNSRGLRGNEILLLLHHKAYCGVAEVQSCLHRLLWHCHRKLFKQLRAWLVHGLLVDTSGEFFIQHNADAQPPLPASSPDGVPLEDAENVFDWHKGFEVRMDLLPPEISDETPLSILFIGKAVRVLRPANSSLEADLLGAGAVLDQLQAMPSFDAGQFELAIEKIRAQAAEKLWQLIVVQGELPLHLAAMREYFLLGRGDFWQGFLLESHDLMSMPVVQATVEANISIPFQQCAAKTNPEAEGLFSRLRIRFPSEASHGASSLAPASVSSRVLNTAATAVSVSGEGLEYSRLSTPATNQFAVDTNAAQAKLTTGLGTAHWASALERATPSTTPQSGDTRGGKSKKHLKVPDYDANWDPLALEYRVQWPLHLLLSPEVMTRYGRMFQYLFRVKRLQMELDLTWAAIKPARGGKAWPLPKGTLPIWQVRSHMAHFINNLQLYIQVDVIEVQYHKLVETMHGVRDLKAAARAHEGFLAACIVQSCLDVPMFSNLLSKMLTICKAFCAHVKRRESGFRDNLLAYPTKLVDDYQRNARLVYKLLSTPSMQSRARAPFLRQLLLRLNFNGFVQLDTDKHAAARIPAVAAS